jgi:hypothetical protein
MHINQDAQGLLQVARIGEPSGRDAPSHHDTAVLLKRFDICTENKTDSELLWQACSLNVTCATCDGTALYGPRARQVAVRMQALHRRGQVPQHVTMCAHVDSILVSMQ